MEREELSNEEKEIIRYCLKEHAPFYVSSVEYLDKLEVDAINIIREAIGNEFINKGLEQNDEPNEYGLKLKSLIDKLGNLYIWPDKWKKIKKKRRKG